MSENKIIRAWGEGCGWTTLIAIVLYILVMIIFLSLIVLAILLPVSDEQSIYLVFGGLLLFLLQLVAGVVVYAAWSAKRHTRILDAAFIPLGLTAKAYLWNGCQYHGTLNGRQVDAYFYRGPHLDIYISSTINTRFGIGLKGRFSQIASNVLHRPELVINDSELAHLSFYPLDGAWGQEILRLPQAKAAILRLTAAQTRLEFRDLLFQPEAIHLQLHRVSLTTITTENVWAWVYDLLDLVKIAEALPAPGITAAASTMERQARMKRSDLTLPILGIACSVFIFFMIIIIVIALVLIYRSGLVFTH